MGSSNWQTIPFCIEALRQIQPKRVLDVGVGFGRWGILVREFCELWAERVHPSTWQVHVEGIEAFPDNIGPWHESFYNAVHRGDARTLLPQLPGPWDLVVFGDVLEHFERDEALRLLDMTLDKASYVLVNIPLGDRYAQGERYGNPYEEHRSEWELGDFVRPETCCNRLVYDSYHRPYLSVVLARNDVRQLFTLGGGPVDLETERQLEDAWDDLLPRAQRRVAQCDTAEARTAQLEQCLTETAARVEQVRRQIEQQQQRLSETESRALAAEARAEAAEAQAAAAEAQAAAAEAQVAVMDANASRIEASAAWRMLRTAERMKLLAVPRAMLRARRRLRGRGNGQVAAPAPVEAAAVTDGNGAALAMDAGIRIGGFTLPQPPGSQDFHRLLQRSPATFEKVFSAPALMSPQERVALYGLAFALAPRRYLEIGTCWGGSAMIVSAALDDLGQGEAFGVDPDPHMTDQTAQLIGPRFRLLRRPSPQALPEAAELAGGPFDLVLVDGDHSRQATLCDLEGVLPLTSPDATILIHDAYNHQVRDAIDEFLAAHPGRVSDAGMVSQSPNRVVNPDGGEEQWGGLRMLRLRGPSHNGELQA